MRVHGGWIACEDLENMIVRIGRNRIRYKCIVRMTARQRRMLRRPNPGSFNRHTHAATIDETPIQVATTTPFRAMHT